MTKFIIASNAEPLFMEDIFVEFANGKLNTREWDKSRPEQKMYVPCITISVLYRKIIYNRRPDMEVKTV